MLVLIVMGQARAEMMRRMSWIPVISAGFSKDMERCGKQKIQIRNCTVINVITKNENKNRKQINENKKLNWLYVCIRVIRN